MTGSSVAPTEALPLVEYCLLICFAGFQTMTLNEMPVFSPNEYFWKNHWDGVEPKWCAYARCVREAMAENGNFELHKTQSEDKVEFKNLIRGKKPA